MNKENQYLSKIAFILCITVMTYAAFIFYPKWKQTQTESTLSWDVSGYYMYLPAVFIYKDIKKCEFKDRILKKYQPTPSFLQGFVHKKSGNIIMKYACGHAVTMMPFFAIAHTYCLSSSIYPPDGFSYPYQICIGIGMLLYAFIGLYFLRKVLLVYFQDMTVAIILSCYVFGTNYLNYASIDQGLTHNVLFTIYCFLIYGTILFHHKPTFRLAAIIGFLVGLATLIRPTDCIAVFIPVLWSINSLNDFKSKFEFIKHHFGQYVIMAILAILMVSLQLFYWKYVSGEWFVYSYEDQGFSWLHPHVLDYTFSYQCGWLRYSPMMILPILGLTVFYKYRINRLAIYSFLLTNFYIVTAWDVWDYGGSAGRAMIQAYPLLAFPFGALIEGAWKTKWTRFLLLLVMGFFAYLNLWWTYHAHAGNIQVTGLTRAYYWKVIGRWNGADEDRILLDNPHAFFGTPHFPVAFYSNHFDKDTSANAFEIGSNRKLKINSKFQTTDAISFAKSSKIKNRIRASAEIQVVQKEWNIWNQPQFIIRFYNNGLEVQSNSIRMHRFIADGESKTIWVDAKVPESNWDRFTIQFWNAGSDKETYIDNLILEAFDD